MNSVPAGTRPVAAPSTTFRSENPPTGTTTASAVLVTVTWASTSSAMVTVAGLNAGAPQTTPSMVGRLISPNVTSVPTGRFCGPFTTVPSARTVAVPEVGTPSSS
ncbi:hypothetical protein D3C74_374770 [compost metagenome]